MSEDSPRQRMIQSAAMVMRERGVDATSFSEVIARSGAPRGSIYHHFPGGKEELIEEATRWAGRFITSWQSNVLDSSGPIAAVDAAASLWKQLLLDSDFTGGCPIVAATVSSDAVRAAKEAAAEAFRSWQRPIADALVAEGLAAGRAEALATMFVGAFEGAVILARAERSVRPVEQVRSELRAAIAAAVAESGGGSRGG
jgi:TetR/AcrR family transcriptional repressor of lmrAB and yxaGH operons